MPKPILVSGIQPTGRLHLGNYLGALKNFVELQNSGKYQCYFFIADLHALTENPDPTELAKNTLDLTITFLAGGLDPQESVIFLQSHVPAHTELGWIFETISPLGEMERMTQFKEKAAQSPKNTNLGLLSYPALMAADILLYDAATVPVGEDQLQHLELTRTLARKFNNKFGKTFLEPSALMTKTPRVMSLHNPSKKMSKSEPLGCLFLDDSPHEVRDKIKRAVTDSGDEVKYDPDRKPAISSLITIYSELDNANVKDIERKYKDGGYADFKNDLIDVVIRVLEPLQKRKKELSVKLSYIKDKLEEGGRNANAIASKKLAEVKKKIGLLI